VDACGLAIDAEDRRQSRSTIAKPNGRDDRGRWPARSVRVSRLQRAGEAIVPCDPTP
jgi:hypothetical protein